MGAKTLDYPEILKYIRTSGDLLLCSYCGAETMCISKRGFCSRCELPLFYHRAEIAATQAQVYQLLGIIATALDNAQYDDAINAYKDILKNNKDPGYLYATANAMLLYSNHRIAQISYDKKGFMDQNAVLRNQAAKLVSDAKALLASIITDEAQLSQAPNSIYVLFLSYLKLGDLRAAANMLDRLEKINYPFALSYARLVFSSAIGAYEAVVKFSEAITNYDNFSVNALFYIARAMFNTGKREQAEDLVVLLTPFIKSHGVAYLLKDIESLDSTWK